MSDNRTSVNVPSGGVIRCLLWSGVMGLKKASVEFAVCRLTLASFSGGGCTTGAPRLQRGAFGSALPFFSPFPFSYVRRWSWHRIRNLCQKGFKVRTERTLLAEPREETCLCVLCQSPSCFINYWKGKGVNTICLRVPPVRVKSTPPGPQDQTLACLYSGL